MVESTETLLREYHPEIFNNPGRRPHRLNPVCHDWLCLIHDNNPDGDMPEFNP